MNIVKREENRLTKENILKHVSQWDILYRAWPSHIELRMNKGAIESPFRNDKDPSFLISMVDDRVVYKDLGAEEYKGGSVFKFIEQMYGLKNLHEVLTWVDKAFNLGYSTGNVIVGKPKEVTWTQPVVEPKKPTDIKVVTRRFNKEELAYWNMFYQDISDLKREHIYAPKEIWRNGRLIPNEILTFCYYCEDIQRWKLYRPHAPKRTKDTPPWLWKWDNSIGSLQYVENIDNMKGPVGLCVKSRKDRMVVRKATGIDAICSIQAEDLAALSDEVLYRMWSDVRYRYIVADSDKKGKQFSQAMCDLHGYRHINTPDEYLPEVNDVAGMAQAYGLDAVITMFKNKIGGLP